MEFSVHICIFQGTCPAVLRFAALLVRTPLSALPPFCWVRCVIFLIAFEVCLFITCLQRFEYVTCCHFLHVSCAWGLSSFRGLWMYHFPQSEERQPWSLPTVAVPSSETPGATAHSCWFFRWLFSVFHLIEFLVAACSSSQRFLCRSMYLLLTQVAPTLWFSPPEAPLPCVSCAQSLL